MTRDEWLAAYKARSTEEATDGERLLASLLERLPRVQAEAGLTPSPDEHGRERRRQRLLDAGLMEPPPESARRALWDRIVRAETAEAAAAVWGQAHHFGSLLACRTVAKWLAPVRVVGSPPLPSTLVFHGLPGRGKTGACLFALSRAQGVYLRSGDVSPGERWDRLVGRARRASLVVLDDLTERLGGWRAGQLADLIEQRHDAGIRMLITSNLEPARLREVLGPRWASREQEAALVCVGGPDMRARPA